MKHTINPTPCRLTQNPQQETSTRYTKPAVCKIHLEKNLWNSHKEKSPAAGIMYLCAE